MAEEKDVKVLSWDEFMADPDIRYDEVELPKGRGLIKLGSVSSGDILDWFDDNESPDKEVRRFAGLRLVVKSIVLPDGSRIPKDQHAAKLAQLKGRDSTENGRLVKACLVLNGLRLKNKGPETTLPNGSSEAASSPTSGDSPTASPLPPVA